MAQRLILLGIVNNIIKPDQASLILVIAVLAAFCVVVAVAVVVVVVVAFQVLKNQQLHRIIFLDQPGLQEILQKFLVSNSNWLDVSSTGK